MFNAKKLDSRSESKNRYNDTEKYYVTCQDRITTDTPTTNDWLSIEHKLTATNNKDLNRILVGVLEKHRHVIIKISSLHTLRKEYTIGESLKHIPGFMNFYCFFQCEGNYKEYPKPSTKTLCEGVGTSMNVLIMPYLTLGSVRLHVWKEDIYACLRSCLLQIVASLFQAYEMHGFIHNDMHLDNVLLKKTKRVDSTYTLHGKTVVIPTYGYVISIMDFEQSLQDTLPTKGQGLIFLYKDIQHAIEDLNYASNICIEHMQELTNTLMDLQNIPFRDWDSYATFQRLQSSIKTLRFLPKPTLSFYTDGYLESG